MENPLERPGYYAVIPADVRYSNKISASTKVFYAEITALCNKTGTCWASNKYFADLYGVQPTRISEWVRQLAAAGFITTKVTKQTTGSKRYIRLTNPLLENQKPSYEKPEDSNIKINNKTNIGDLGLQLLALVNEVTGRNFRTLPDRGVKKTLDAFSLDEIRAALTALVADDWHKEHLKEFKIDYLIRSTTIDKFMDQAKPKSLAEIAKEQDERVRRRAAE